MILDKLLYIYNNHEAQPKDRLLSEFFLRQKDHIEVIQLTHVEKETGLSKSTITRFCNSLNCDNFTIFKYEFHHSLRRKSRLRDDTTKPVYSEFVKVLQNELLGMTTLVVFGDDLDSTMLSVFARRLYMSSVLLKVVSVLYEEPLVIDEETQCIYVSSQFPFTRYHDQTLKNKTSKAVYDSVNTDTGLKIYPSDTKLKSKYSYQLNNGDVFANQREIHHLFQELCDALEKNT